MSMMKTMMMMKLVEKKRRYTDDGRSCSTAFSYNGKAYTDCTTDLSPDGNMGKEWCFVSMAAKGDKFWSWCKPSLDWDKIREKNQDEMKKIGIKGRMVREKIEKWIKPGMEIMDTVKNIRNGQAGFDDKLSKLVAEVSGMDDTFKQMKELKPQWEQHELTVITSSDEIDKIKTMQKEAASNKQPQSLNPSPEIIKMEKEAYGVTINTFTQIKVVVDTIDCTGLLNYEDEPLGDGLLASYYDNENFQGKAVEQKDGPIQFNWTGSAPVTGVNSSNYSIRFTGYIYIPYTSRYKFAVECDDSAKLTVGGRTVVKMGYYTEFETFSSVDKWLKAVAVANADTKQSAKKSSDDTIYLIGGTKEKIVLEYSRSTANDILEDEKAFLNIFWESDNLEESIISKRYFYSDNSPAPLKIGGIDKNIGIIRKLAENDMAFKDSDRYMLMDVPIQYLGLPTLKLDVKYTQTNLTFTTTEITAIYVAVIENFPNPLEKGWDDTGQYMTLMIIDKDKTARFPGKIYGETSSLLQIFRKKFPAGNVDIPLELKGLNVKGLSMIVFLGSDDDEPMECGGEEIWISEPNNSNGHFKECTESSRQNDFRSCRQGLSGSFQDKEGSIWNSKNEGINAWLDVQFQRLYKITKIEYQDRNNPNERNSKIIAKFSDGSKFDMDMINSNDKLTFNIEPPLMSNSVKFVINKVYGTINNGGSFKVYGQKCYSKDEVAVANAGDVKTMFTFPDTTIITIACGESMINASSKFSAIKKSPGVSVKIKCPENCALTAGNIYGSEKYSMDSAICKAAYHSKKLPDDGGLVQLNFEIPIPNYKDEFMRGIQSGRKKGSRYTLSFDIAEDDNAIKLANGIKVDAKVNKVWVKGIIIDIKETPTGKDIYITIEDTENSKAIPFSFPSPDLKLCGEMIKNRDCKGSRKIFVNQPFKFRFGPSTYTKMGVAEVDNGEVYGKCGKSYGWNIDMSKNMKQKDGAKQVELETFVEFNYSPNSSKCKEISPEISCENASWTVKVGHGKFNVKLYVGQPFLPSTVNFIINGKPVAINKIIQAGTLEMIDSRIDSIDEKITIQGQCVTNCKDSRTILNMVEIVPVNETPPDKDAGIASNASTCNNAISGGQCKTGIGNILHCLYDNAQSPGASSCGGTNWFVKVPAGYRCIDQIGKYKCAKKTYENKDECLKYCPQPCQNEKCFTT